MTSRCCRSEDYRRWFRGPLSHLCSAYVLYYWGENMWQFALGLYLVHFEDGILRLVAIFGFAAAGSILLCGGLLGNWVDKTRRLTAMKVAIFVQDAAVCSCSLIVFFVVKFENDVKTIWSGGLWMLLVTIIIILSIIAQLFGMVFKISLERDWFVVVAGGDTTLLARINSVTRTLDQICMILAPLVAGQIMTHVSLKMAALIIAGYSLVTVFIKYTLILMIYRRVPGLARAKRGCVQIADDHHDCNNGTGYSNRKPLNSTDDDAPEKVTAASTAEETLLKQETDKIQSVECQFLTSKEAKDSTNDDVNCEGSADGKKEITSAQEQQQSSRPAVKDSCLQPLCKDLLVLCTGWRVYAKQTVALAGMGLACLYMTVLGFHAVTIGYAYANGITESIVGILTGLAGIAGILGSLIYPMLRTKLGLEKTGIFGFWFEISCLTLPLISIWLPGSPFEPRYSLASPEPTLSACSEAPTAYALKVYNNSDASTVNGTYDATSDAPCVPTSVVTPSIVVFLIGVILSRIGLWIADLTVAQLMQEKVAESERGVVNGVQNSLSMLFEIIKYVLVIILPYVHTYGILIMLSYGFVLTGALLFLVFVWKFRKEVSLRCETNLLPTPDYDNRPTREKTDV